MRAPYWDVLGIEPTPDEGIVRRAYAAKLRVTNPEDDADGFKQLREAYEHAMGHARYLQMNPPGKDVDEDDIQDDVDTGQRTISIPPAPSAPGVSHTPVETATLDPLEIERRDHDALCQNLMGALQDDGQANTRVDTFNAVIKSPAMQQLDVFTATEGWIIHTLISMRPATDPLFDPAIAYFKWEDQRVGDRNGGAQHILYLRQRVDQELDAQRLLARMKDKKHEFHRAWKETTRPPSERSWLDKALSKRHQTRVTEFLEYLSRRSPVAIESLNQEAVSYWWDGRSKRSKSGSSAAHTPAIARVIIMIIIATLYWGLPSIMGWLNNESRPSYWLSSRDSPRPAPPPKAKSDDSYRSLLELVSPNATDAEKRYAARRDCKEATKRLGKTPPGVKTLATSEAEVRCKKILEMTPDSLLMRQYAGIVALRLDEPDAALEHFAAILKQSPDDAYALFGKGLVSTIGPEASNLGRAKDMADALALNTDVAPYFAAFGLEAPDVEPAAKKPRSKLPKLESIRAETAGERLDNAGALDGQGLSDHFGLDGTTAGKVVLECVINTKGRATNCHVRSEEPANVGLGEVGLLAMKDIRYKPPMTAGEPVGGMPLRYTLSYNTEEPDTPAKK